MVFKKATVLVFVAALMVSGCFFRLDLTSEINFSDASMAIKDIKKIRARVLAHAKEFGGKCVLSEHGASCYFPDMKGSLGVIINVGLDRKGVAYTNIHSVITTVFPGNRGVVLSGEDLPQFHLQWEQWMLTAFDDYEQESRLRKVSGYDAVHRL